MDGAKIALGLATVGIGSMGSFLAVGLLFFPAELRIDESVVTGATAEEVWAEVGPLRQWATWSPWRAERDASLSVEYAGPKEGFGARMTWTSEGSGSGTLRVTDVEPGVSQSWEVSLAGGALTFHESIGLEPAGEGTRIRWVSTADLGFNPFNRYYGAWIRDGLEEERREALKLLAARVGGG